MSELGLTVPDELLDDLAERVAARVGDRLADRIAESNTLGLNGLVSLDQLVDSLPKTKPAETWRRWIYVQVAQPEKVTAMGATKIGGNWYFSAEKATEWLSTRW